MASSPDSVSMALFCDFENVALGVRDAKYDKFDIKRVLERLLLKGSIVVKKAYCDWDRYKSFKAAMHEANFELIEIPHVRQSGKNSADIRLVVDALDLCYTKSHVDTFVIISGDSDFSPLVSKLRENAKQVIGVGVKQSTSDLLIANCDEFIFYDDLVRDSQRVAAKREARDNVPASKRSSEEEKLRREEVEARRGKAIDIAVETFDALLAERGESGKIWSSMLKEAIKRRKPDFNESYFGFRAFGNLLEEAQSRGLLELGRDEKSGTYVTRPGPGAVVTEPYPSQREARRVEAPEVEEYAHADVERATAVAEPAAREARASGRGTRRRGGKAGAAESSSTQAAPAPHAPEWALPSEENAHAPAVTESRNAERPEAGTQAEAAPKSRGGRGRGRGTAAKVEAVKGEAATALPAEAAQSPSVEPVAVVRSDEHTVDEDSAKPTKRGSARAARKPAASTGHKGATEAASAGASLAAVPAKAGRNRTRTAASAPAAASEHAAAEPADAGAGEPASARKAPPRARRPRKPKTDAGE
jgi:uncharacterized protein (TIGR00288 family)